MTAKIWTACLLAICYSFSPNIVCAQQHKIDSLQRVLMVTKTDSGRSYLLLSIGIKMRYSKIDSAIYYCQQSLELTKKINWEERSADAYRWLGVLHGLNNDSTMAWQCYMSALNIADKFVVRRNKDAAITGLSLKAHTLKEMGNTLLSLGRYNSSIDIYEHAIKLYEQIGDEKYMGETQINLGVAYEYLNNYPNSLEYFFKSLKIHTKYENTYSIAATLVNIVQVYIAMNDLISAKKHIDSALKYSLASGDVTMIDVCYSRYGMISYADGERYSASKDTGNALKSYSISAHYDELSLKLQETNSDYVSLAYTYVHLGQTYGAIAKLCKSDTCRYMNNMRAIDYTKKAISIAESHPDKWLLAKALTNAGNHYTHIAHFDSAGAYLYKALAVQKELGDNDDMEYIKYSLSEMYRMANVPDSSYKYLKDCYQYGKSKNTDAITKKIAELQAQYETEKKDNEILSLSNARRIQALQLNEQQYRLTEQILLAEQRANELKLVSQAKELDSIELQQQRLLAAENEQKLKLQTALTETEKERRSFMVIGFGAFILLAAFSGYYFYQRRQLAFSKQVSETEMKALRAQMNPHFIFNALNSIYTCLLQNRHEEAKQYLLDFAKLTRMILENSLHQFISLEDELRAMKLYVSIEELRLNKKLELTIDVADDVDIESTMIPPLILQPFIENSIWHGFPHRDGKISINVHHKDGMLQCVVTDNGTGIPQQKSMMVHTIAEKKESLGLKLTRQRIDIINKLKKSNGYVAINNILNNNQQVEGVKAELVLPLEMKY